MELSERYIQTLEKEGFPHVFEWTDEPGTVYQEHAHNDKVTIFITDGSLRMDLGGEIKNLKAGDRLDVPPGISHSAVVGPEGCNVVVGEMIEGDS